MPREDGRTRWTGWLWIWIGWTGLALFLGVSSSLAYISVGNYQAATQVALGTGEDDSTPAFDKLEQALSDGIRESRNQLRTDIINARRVLSGATVGGMVLSLSAALAVALGLWPRMSEYR